MSDPNPADVDEIFRRLAAPFDAAEVKVLEKKGVKPLQYITARTARKRLNEVLGPDHWENAIEATPEWVRSSLTIILPDGRRITRQALGGYPKMPSAEDQVKGGDSDAFKRAAALFGVGEFLYGDETAFVDQYGRELPTERPSPAATDPRRRAPESPRDDDGEPSGRVWTPWCQWFYTHSNDRWAAHLEQHRVDREERSQLVQHPEEVVNLVCSHAIELGHIDPAAVAKVNGTRDPGRARTAVADLFRRAPKKVKAHVREHFRALAEAECMRLGIDPGPYASATGAAADPAPDPAPQSGDDPPRTGKALFAWCKAMEQRHEVRVLKYLNGWAKLQEFPFRMVDWDADQVGRAYQEARRKLGSLRDPRDALDEALSN